jgi:hypothetical protein
LWLLFLIEVHFLKKNIVFGVKTGETVEKKGKILATSEPQELHQSPTEISNSKSQPKVVGPSEVPISQQNQLPLNSRC